MRTGPRLRKNIYCICDWGAPTKRKSSKLVDYMTVFRKKLVSICVGRSTTECASFYGNSIITRGVAEATECSWTRLLPP